MRFSIYVRTFLACAIVIVGAGNAAAQGTGGSPGVHGATGNPGSAGSVWGTVSSVGNGDITVGVSGQPASGPNSGESLPAGTYPLSARVKVVIQGIGAHGTIAQVQDGEFVRLVIGPSGLVDVIIVHPHQQSGGSGGGGSQGGVPTSVAAMESPTGAALTWTAVTGATSYQVLESSGSGYSQVAAANGGTPTSNSTTITGLTAGLAYSFEVEAVLSGTASAPSSASNTIEWGARSGASSLIDVSYSGGIWCATVAITYDKSLDPTSLDTTLSDYTITANGQASHPASVAVSGGELLLDQDVCNSGDHTIQVTTVNSVVSDEAGAPTTPIDATSTLGSASGVVAWESPSGISVTWPTVAGASSYQVLESNGGTYSAVPAADGGTPSTNTATITGLASGTTYSFEVQTIVSGTQSAASSPSNAVEWGAAAYGTVTTVLSQNGSQDNLTFAIAYDQDLSSTSVNGAVTDYTVTDLTTGTAIAVSAVSVVGNTVVIQASGPSTLNPTDLVEVTSAASVVNDSAGAPTTPISATGTF